jgi:hypothetical protein
MLEIVDLPAEILLHRERHRLGRTRQQTCAQAGGDCTAK